MSDSERTDPDLANAPMRFSQTEERLQGYALGCLQSCTSLLALTAFLVLIVAILFV